MTLNAYVKAGRLVVDEPTDLPEGTTVKLVPFPDHLSPAQRDALYALEVLHTLFDASDAEVADVIAKIRRAIVAVLLKHRKVAGKA